VRRPRGLTSATESARREARHGSVVETITLAGEPSASHCDWESSNQNRRHLSDTPCRAFGWQWESLLFTHHRSTGRARMREHPAPSIEPGPQAGANRHGFSVTTALHRNAFCLHTCARSSPHPAITLEIAALRSTMTRFSSAYFTSQERHMVALTSEPHGERYLRDHSASRVADRRRTPRG